MSKTCILHIKNTARDGIKDKNVIIVPLKMAYFAQKTRCAKITICTPR